MPKALVGREDDEVGEEWNQGKEELLGRDVLSDCTGLVQGDPKLTADHNLESGRERERERESISQVIRECVFDHRSTLTGQGPRL